MICISLMILWLTDRGTSKEILTVTLDTIYTCVQNQTIKFIRETSKDTAKLGENIISKLGVGLCEFGQRLFDV